MHRKQSRKSVLLTVPSDHLPGAGIFCTICSSTSSTFRPVFCGNPRSILRFQSDDILDLCNYTVRLGAWKVYFVDDREHIQVMVKGEIDVGKGLRLDTLRCIDNEQRAVACGRLLETS